MKIKIKSWWLPKEKEKRVQIPGVRSDLIPPKSTIIANKEYVKKEHLEFNKGPKTKEAESKISNKYDHIDLDLLLLEEFGMEITYPSEYFKTNKVIVTGEGRQLTVYSGCIVYLNTLIDKNIPITNDIFILADIIREKYNIETKYNIFTDAKIDGGI